METPPISESAEVVSERIVQAVALALALGSRVELAQCVLTIDHAEWEMEGHLCDILGLGGRSELRSTQCRIWKLIRSSGRAILRRGAIEAGCDPWYERAVSA